MFLIDDSPLALVALKRILGVAPAIEVVGAARGAREALQALAAARPGVICVGHHPPALDGAALIRQIMANFPRPILAIGAGLDPLEPAQIAPLLEAGAIDCIAQIGAAHSPQQAAALVQKIKLLSGVMVFSRRAGAVSAGATFASAISAGAISAGAVSAGAVSGARADAGLVASDTAKRGANEKREANPELSANPTTETNSSRALPDSHNSGANMPREAGANRSETESGSTTGNGSARSGALAIESSLTHSSAAPQTQRAAPLFLSAAHRDNAHREKPDAISAAPISNPMETAAPPVLRPYQPHPIRILAIGASTGGPQVLQRIFARLPADLSCPIVCVQHISAGFLQGFVDWLGEGCRVRIKIAAPGEIAQPGMVYFPPEGRHLEIDHSGHLHPSDAPPIGGHKPAATVLFESVARAYGCHALGVLLTGMGNDGAPGLEAIMRAGGATIAQDEASCVVFGMPKQAIVRGAAHFVLDPDGISAHIARLVG